jgi:hypothetical protein
MAAGAGLLKKRIFSSLIDILSQDVGGHKGVEEINFLLTAHLAISILKSQ